MEKKVLWQVIKGLKGAKLKKPDTEFSSGQALIYKDGLVSASEHNIKSKKARTRIFATKKFCFFSCAGSLEKRAGTFLHFKTKKSCFFSKKIRYKARFLPASPNPIGVKQEHFSLEPGPWNLNPGI